MKDNLKCCPYCGGEEYYTKDHVKGIATTRYRFDGEFCDNGDMYEGISIQII